MLTAQKYVFAIATLVFGVVASSDLSDKISPSLLLSLKAKGATNIFVNFDGGNKAALASVEGRSYRGGRAEKITALKAALESHASISQRNIQQFLKDNSIPFKSLWISNQIVIKKADLKLVQDLAKFSQISRLIEVPKVNLEPIRSVKSQANSQNEELAWGIEKIQIEEAWKIANGTGVVVGMVDTGARHTHEALRDNFFGLEYGWFDVVMGEEIPYDSYQHGTHVMGTIAGTGNQNGTLKIGIAPGAKWMACQACPDPFECGIEYWVECAQWFLCPTRRNGTEPDCSKAPHVINNSWGSGTGENYFDDVAAAWRAANIIPIFAMGNYGSGCTTILHPGELENVIAAGATNIRDEIAWFSSRGPTVDGRLKPDLSAPGEGVFSAMPTADDAYGNMSGTSMASPHVAGVATLLLSLNPNMTFTELRNALLEGVDVSLTSGNQTCGGIPDTQFPNNVFGQGRLNAYKSLQAALKTIK